MLRGKIYPNFKGVENCLLIIGGAEEYREIAAFFENQNSSAIFLRDIVSLEDCGTADVRQVTFKPDEAMRFHEICLSLSSHKKPAHYYMIKDSVPEIEMLISCGEYDRLPG